MTSRRTTPAPLPTRPEPEDAERTSARAIMASLRAGEPTSSEIYEAFWQLDSLPLEEVREALASWVGPLPDLDRLDPARRLALGLPLRPLRLRTLFVAKDADILDLGPIAEDQLRVAGKTWDGVDVPPEDRLDGEVEGSLAGTFERRVLADAEAAAETPLFDVLLYGEDAGVVFTAGTSNVVGLIAYGIVEMRDRRTRIAIQEALAAPVALAEQAAPVVIVAHAPVAGIETAPTFAVAAVVQATPEAEAVPEVHVAPSRVAASTVSSKAPAKKTVATKAVSKKTAKKPIVKKPIVKKPIVKKPIVKKVLATKAAKNSVAKKAPAKKAGKNAVAKTVLAQKPAQKPAKKVVAKKPAQKSAKKVVAKKSAKKVVAKKALAKKAAKKSAKRR